MVRRQKAGTDFIVARDGRICRRLSLFERYPELKPELDSAVRRLLRRIASERFPQQHHERLGTTSATRRSICSASSKTGVLSRISSAPATATSRRTLHAGVGRPLGPATASKPLNSKNGWCLVI